MKLSKTQAEHFMKQALAEAQKGVGKTSPNPAVGAILVKGGKVVGRGYHKKAGAPHAEVLAIKQAGTKAKGADLYTTLEPCNHHGKTPPCTEAILKAGIGRVVFASRDPNPLVNGSGLEKLNKAGVKVVGPVLKDEADALNRPFFKFMRTGLPYVTLKVAMTLDGKLATSTGDSKWISGEASRRWVHEFRSHVDAGLVGWGCVEKDNPLLTSRGPKHARNPVRVVVDSKLTLPVTLQVFGSESRTIVGTLASADSPRARALTSKGVEVWALPEKEGKVALRPLLEKLGKSGVLHVMVEGGAEVFARFLSEGLFDSLKVFVAPKLVGASGMSWVGPLNISQMSSALPLKLIATEPTGEDVLFHFEKQ